MQRLYPDRLSTFQINYIEKPDLNDLALKIKKLEFEVNVGRVFIPDEVISVYMDLLKNADTFFKAAQNIMNTGIIARKII